MAQHYSDPTRESDPHALPDIEVFWAYDGQWIELDDFADPVPSLPGWYWWSCFPGCLPDSEPVGPFATEAEALADAREGMD